jgi:hypothetical protein
MSVESAAKRVDFVDDDDDFGDVEELQQVGVAVGLILDPFDRVDDQDGRVGVGGTGHHVADELAVSGGVDEDDSAFVMVQPHARRLDRDRLVALFLCGVDRERPLDRVEVPPLAGSHDLLGLPVGEAPGIVEQPADERRLPVIDVACDRYAEIHYMYPAARSRSNDDSLS